MNRILGCDSDETSRLPAIAQKYKSRDPSNAKRLDNIAGFIDIDLAYGHAGIF
jgi:hypothetical protein